jgi:hypothetical protein
VRRLARGWQTSPGSNSTLPTRQTRCITSSRAAGRAGQAGQTRRGGEGHGSWPLSTHHSPRKERPRCPVLFAPRAVPSARAKAGCKKRRCAC